MYKDHRDEHIQKAIFVHGWIFKLDLPGKKKKKTALAFCFHRKSPEGIDRCPGKWGLNMIYSDIWVSY